jgi:hypothetical protein
MPKGKPCATCNHAKSIHYTDGCVRKDCECKEYVYVAFPKPPPPSIGAQLSAFGVGMRKRFGKFVVRLGRRISNCGGN